MPYTDCKMYMEETTYNETDIVTDGQYIPWECSNYTKLETHVKLVPKCVNVTRSVLYPVLDSAVLRLIVPFVPTYVRVHYYY